MKVRNKWLLPAGLVLLALVGMLALWRSTPYGLGLVNDSATYVEGAASLMAGNGYARVSGGGEIKPITHFPPLFSIVLAGFGLAGLDQLSAARVLITLLFGLDIVLVGLSVYKISRSVGFALLGALLLGVSDVFLGVYSFALSEPLFLTLMLAAYLSLAVSMENPHWKWAALAGLLLSLAYLTRYAGVSLFITAVLVVLLMRPPQTIRQLGLMLAGAILPVVAWHGYSLARAGLGSLGNRQLLWHPIPLGTFFEALKNMLTWVAPNDLLSAGVIWGRMLSLASLLLLPGLLTGLAWSVRKRWVTSQPGGLNGSDTLFFTQALHCVVYLAFLVVSITFFDASTPLNDRILSVAYLPENILFACGLAWLWNRLAGKWAVARWLLAVFCLALALFSARDGYTAMNVLAREGQGFAHRGISGSPAMQAIRLMPSTIIYSNKPGAIFLLTGKNAYVTPTPQDPATGRPRPAYQADLELMHQAVRQGQAVLVLFGLRDSPDLEEVSLFKDLSDDLTLHADYGEIVIFGGSR